MWVAVTTESLVVVEDDLAGLEQAAGLVEDDLADPRMLPDEVPLSRGERARLLQDLLGHRDLADVVEEGSDPDPFDLQVGQLEVPGDRHSDSGDEHGRLATVVRHRRDDFAEGSLGSLPGDGGDLQGSSATGRRDWRARNSSIVVGLLEDVGLVATQGFRRVHRLVGVSNEGLGAQGLALATGDADGDRDRDRELRARLEHAALNEEPKLLGHLGGFLRARLRKDDHEFLAAVAAYDVGLAQIRTEQVRHTPEHDVADLMAVRVVDDFEMVEVDEGDRQRTTMSHGAVDFCEEDREDGSPVRYLGQEIGGGRVVCLGQLGRDRVDRSGELAQQAVSRMVDRDAELTVGQSPGDREDGPQAPNGQPAQCHRGAERQAARDGRWGEAAAMLDGHYHRAPGKHAEADQDDHGETKQDASRPHGRKLAAKRVPPHDPLVLASMNQRRSSRIGGSHRKREQIRRS